MQATLRFGLMVLVSLAGALPLAAQTRGSVTLPSEQFLNRAGLTRAWWGQAVSNATRDKIRYITLDKDNLLYVQSSNSVVTCFDAESGRKLWGTRLGNPDEVLQQCSYTDDLVFCIHGNTCHAVNKRSGNVAWTLDLPGTPSTGPSTDGTRLYVGMTDGSMYAFDYLKIAKLSEQGLMPQWSFTTMVWRYKTGGTIVSPAVPAGRLVAFASQSGSLYSVTAEDRRLIYQFETDSRLSAPVVRYRDWLVLAGQDYNVYALHVDNGRIGWQFPAGSEVRRAPVVIGDEVYLSPERTGMYKLAADTGKKVWNNLRLREFLSASFERVYARDVGGQVAIVSRQTGTPLASLPLSAFTLSVQNEQNDRLYIASPSGLILCLRELDLDYPASHYDLDDKPIVPVIGPDAPPAAVQPAEPAADPAAAPATEEKME